MISDCINYNKNSAYCEYIGHNVMCSHKGELSKCILQTNYAGDSNDCISESILPNTKELKTKYYLQFTFCSNCEVSDIWITTLKTVNKCGLHFKSDSFDIIYVRDDVEDSVLRCSGIIDKIYTYIIEDEYEVNKRIAELVKCLTESLKTNIVEFKCIKI